MGSPTADQVHVPTAIGNDKKGKRPMAGKAKMGKVPPQFLPKQKGEPDGDEGKGGKMSKKPAAKMGSKKK